MTLRRFFAPVALFLMVAWAIHDARQSGFLDLSHQQTDLRSFYCAGSVLNAGGDPYRLEPLRSCERNLAGLRLNEDPEFVVPAPLPGFALALFRAAAVLPFSTVATLWTTLGCAALLASIVLLSRIAPILCVAAALLLSAGLPSIVQGQLMLFEMAAIAAAGVAAMADADFVAGAFAAACLFEPHIGIPICASVAVLLPRARLTLAAGIALLAAIDVWSTSLRLTIEYLTVVIPAQVGVELPYQEQYSLSYALDYFGANPSVALAVGSASYIALATLAIVLARRLSRQIGLRSNIIFMPAALSVMGGSYMHVTQIAAAVPLALSLRGFASARWQAVLLTFATMLIAVPWPYPYTSKPLMASSIVSLAVIGWYGGSRLARFTTPGFVFTIVLLWLLENRPRIVNPVVHATYRSPSSLTQIAWHDYVLTRMSHDAAFFATKCLTWVGLLLLLTVASSVLVSSRSRRRLARLVSSA